MKKSFLIVTMQLISTQFSWKTINKDSIRLSWMTTIDFARKHPVGQLRLPTIYCLIIVDRNFILEMYWCLYISTLITERITCVGVAAQEPG